MAASVYRIAVLQKQYTHIPNAERARKSLFAADGSHIDSDGWLSPVVNPTDFSSQGEHSPEGEAFILLLQSAYRDWSTAGSKGVNASVRIGVHTILYLFVVALVAFILAV